MDETASLLHGKTLLVVDDEVDVLETVKEILDACRVYTARDYDTALQYLLSYTFDIVILDIMGVNGFELLKTSVNRGFPTVMLTAYALTPEALKKSIQLGAVSFLPKEKMSFLPEYLTDVVLGAGKPVWRKVFERLGRFFDKRFGANWQERSQRFEAFKEAVYTDEKQENGPTKD